MEELEINRQVYELFGKFLIRFEQVSHLMRYGILYLIFPDHTDKNIRQNEILMESLTADQIRNKYLALIAEEFECETYIFKIAKTISTVYEKVIPIRNSFTHGTSFIGKTPLNENAADGMLLLRHPKLKKKGLDLNFKKYEIHALKKSIHLCERLSFCVAITSIEIQTIQKTETTYEFPNGKYFESLTSELLYLESKLQALLSK